LVLGLSSQLLQLGIDSSLHAFSNPFEEIHPRPHDSKTRSYRIGDSVMTGKALGNTRNECRDYLHREQG
jgi:hypothetical protein